jgi:hypothetical protein
MKITIFGDSFGDDTIESLIQSETSWIDVLRENGHIITNFSKGGSSLYYSYERYLKYIDSHSYEEYDLIIFVMTGPGREEIVFGKDTFYLTSISQIEVIRDLLARDEEQRRILEAIRIYWAFCKDVRKDRVFHDLLIKDIKSRERMFFIQTWIEGDDNDIVELSRKELALINPDIRNENEETKFMKLHRDNRKCHFTSVNNRMLGNKILQAINAKQQTVDFDINDIVKPEFDTQYYFTKYD